MPGTITSDLVTINAADSTTGWTSGGPSAARLTRASNADSKIQGTRCLAWTVSTTSFLADQKVTYIAAAYDLSGTDVHIFAWVNNLQGTNLATKANGGIRLYAQCTSTTWAYPATAYREWYLDGSDTDIVGGWRCYVVSPNLAPVIGRSAGTWAGSAVKFIGIVETQLTSTTGICFMNDALRYGTGITVVNGTDGAEAAFADIYATDSNINNAWGILTRSSDIYFGAGKIRIGTISQTAITRFKDTGQVLVWRNDPVTTTLYDFVLNGTGTFNTVMQLGDYSGGLSSGGCTIKGAGNTATTNHSVWNITANANSTFRGYGCNFSELRRATLTSTSELRNCNFSTFGDITIEDGTIVTECLFQDVKTTAPISGAYALVVPSASAMAGVTNSTFVNCNRAIKITAAGTYTFDALLFEGNVYDIENASSGLVTINCTNGSNPTTYINTGGGTTVINNTVSLTLTGIKTSGPILSTGSEIRIYQHGTINELAGLENCTTGEFQYNYTYAPNTYVDIVVMHEEYLYYRIDNYLLGSENGSIPIQQTLDRQYSNPGVLTFSITGSTTLTNGGSQSYSAPTYGNATYTWSVQSGEATISSGQGTNSVSVTSSTDGPFVLRCQIALSNGSSGSATLEVTVSSVQIEFVQAYKSASNSVKTQTNVAVQAGDLIIVAFRSDSLTSVSCSDTAGNTYRQVGTATQTSNATNWTAVFYAVANATGTISTITIGGTNSGYMTIITHVVRGMRQNVDEVLDVYAYDVAEGATSTSHVSAQITTTNANNYLFVFWSQDVTNGVNLTDNTGGLWTERQEHTDWNTGGPSTSFDRIVSSTGTYSQSVTASTASYEANVIIAFKGQ